MQTNLEQAIEIIKALPVDNYGRPREVIDKVEQDKRGKEKIELAN